MRECLDTGVSYAAIATVIAPARHPGCAAGLCAGHPVHPQSRGMEPGQGRLAATAVRRAPVHPCGWLRHLADPRAEIRLRESSGWRPAGASACQFGYDISRGTLFAEPTVSIRIDDRPGFTRSQVRRRTARRWGKKSRRLRHARADFRDDPPCFSTRASRWRITSRGLLHHPLHAKAVFDRCRETGVGVVAEPGLDIKPGNDDPPSLRNSLPASQGCAGRGKPDRANHNENSEHLRGTS